MIQGINTYPWGAQAGDAGLLAPGPCVPAPALLSSAVDHANFPITAAGFATACGVPAMLPSRIFNLQETSGPVLCALTNEMLVPSFSNGSALALGESTDGLATARVAVTVPAATYDGLIATNSSFMRPGNGPMAIGVVFRAQAYSANTGLVGYGRGINDASDPLEHGGIISNLNSSGLLGSAISDGTSAVGGNLVGTGLKDGNWHFAVLLLDSSGNVKSLHEGGGHSRNASSLSFPANAKGYFTVGANRYIASATEFVYLVCFEDTTAVDAITSAGLATFLAQAEA